eukprot:1160727-Pelagomonas_calceolata.AAC.29
MPAEWSQGVQYVWFASEMVGGGAVCLADLPEKRLEGGSMPGNFAIEMGNYLRGAAYLLEALPKKWADGWRRSEIGRMHVFANASQHGASLCNQTVFCPCTATSAYACALIPKAEARCADITPGLGAKPGDKEAGAISTGQTWGVLKYLEERKSGKGEELFLSNALVTPKKPALKRRGVSKGYATCIWT